MAAYSHPQELITTVSCLLGDFSVGLQKTVTDGVNKSMEKSRQVVIDTAKAPG